MTQNKAEENEEEKERGTHLKILPIILRIFWSSVSFNGLLMIFFP
jgi:hypothetical protein